MALQTYAGTFTLTSGITTQDITGIVDKDGASFTPKMIIAWGDHNTSEATFTANNSGFFGVAIDRATDQQSLIAWISEDNLAARNAARLKRVDAFIGIVTGATTPTYQVIASISSFSSGAFQINKTTNTGSLLPIVKFLAIGGSDLEDAFLQEETIPATTGNQAYTGYPWQGNLALFFGLEFGTSGTQQGSNAYPAFGVAKDSSNRASVTAYVSDAATSTTSVESYITSSKCYARYLSATNAVGAQADFVSWNSDGFTLNWSNVPGSAQVMFAVAMKGTFQSSINTQARPTSATTQDITTNFPPIAGMIFGAYPTALDTETNENAMIIGAFDKTRNHGKWWGDDNVINTDANMYSSATNVYTQATNPSTVDAQAAVSAFSATDFTMNFTTADANARYYFSLALGSGAFTPDAGALSASGTQSVLNRGIYTRSMIQGT